MRQLNNLLKFNLPLADTFAMNMLITTALLTITVILLLFLIFCWIYLSKFNRPINDKIRKAFSSKYDAVAAPFTLLLICLALTFAFFSFSTWFYFKKLDVKDGIFFTMGLFFVFSAIDIALAFTIKKLFEKFA